MLTIIKIIFTLLIFIAAFVVFILFFKNKTRKTKKNTEKPKILNKYILTEEGDFIDPPNNIVLPVFTIFEKRIEKGAKKLCVYSPDFLKRVLGHSITIGGTGRGKTSKLVEPLIFFNAQIKDIKKRPCMVIPDPSTGTSESLYKRYAGYLKNQGYKIKVINLDAENIKMKDGKINSDFYNPMLSIWKSQDNPDLLFKNIETFSKTILPEKGSVTDYHWINSARNIINGFIMYMIETKQYSENTFNILNLSELLSKDFHSVALKLEDKLEFPRSNMFTNLHLKGMYIDKEKRITKEIASILSTINSSVEIFKRPLLHQITSTNNINFQEIAEDTNPTAFFIESKLDASDTSGLSLVTTFIQDLSTFWMKDIKERPIMFIMDEFNSFPIIEKLIYFLEQGRKFNLWFFIFVQSLNNVLEKYKFKGGLSLSNFYTKIVLGTEDKQDINLILQDYKEDTERTSLSMSNNGHISHSVSDMEKEAILTKDIKTLTGGQSIVVARGVPPTIFNLDPLSKLGIKKKLVEINEVWNKLSNQELKPIIIKRTLKEYNEFKKELVNIFKYFYGRKDINKFKEKFVDTIKFGIWKQNTPKTDEAIWIKIKSEFQELLLLNNKEKDSEIIKKNEEAINSINSMLFNLAPNKNIKDWFIKK